VPRNVACCNAVDSDILEEAYPRQSARRPTTNGSAFAQRRADHLLQQGAVDNPPAKTIWTSPNPAYEGSGRSVPLPILTTRNRCWRLCYAPRRRKATRMGAEGVVNTGHAHHRRFEPTSLRRGSGFGCEFAENLCSRTPITLLPREFRTDVGTGSAPDMIKSDVVFP